ncbi:MAG: UPF0182 family protein, partial [Ilumatobacter sp.]|nr:UPF0182 family protein [Ilumatobacter sp.]
RSVFTTVLVTRALIFLAVTVGMGAIIFGAMALAYRSRPVFVPVSGPDDPVARYRTAALIRLKMFGIGIPAVLGALAGVVAQSYWSRVQLFLHGGSFGVTDPEFHKDLGFYAFDLPFYRMIVTLLLVSFFLALLASVATHYVFGGIRLAGRDGTLSRPARIQLVCLVGTLVLLKALAYWLDRYELLSHTRGGKPFTGAGYTDINAVLPAKLILMAIALICAVTVFSALVLKDLRIPAIGLALLLLSSLVIGAGWPLIVEQFNVKPNAAQKESAYITRSIDATRQAYGLTPQYVEYREYGGGPSVTAEQIGRDSATVSNIRVLDPTIISPAFTQFNQGKNFYSFPDQLSIDRYIVEGQLRDFVVAARELNPTKLTENQRDWINRHSVYTHGNGFIAAPANTVSRIANDPNQNGGYPVFQTRVIGANGKLSPDVGPAPLEQPRIYFGPIIANTAADYAIVGGPGDPREYDSETSNYTYTGTGGVPVSSWIDRSMFALKFAERNFLFSNVIGDGSKILFNRDPAKRVAAVAPWLTTDSSQYPAIVDKRLVWVIDGYTTSNRYPFGEPADTSQLAGGSGLGGNFNYVRNSVKATVNAYDGSITLYAMDSAEPDPVLEVWRSAFPDLFTPASEMPDTLREHLRYPEELFRVQTTAYSKYRLDAADFFARRGAWSVSLAPREQPTKNAVSTSATTDTTNTSEDTAVQTDFASDSDAARFVPYYTMFHAEGSDEATFAMFRPFSPFSASDQRKELVAYMVADSDPGNYGQLIAYVLPAGSLPDGPFTVGAAMDADGQVSREATLLDSAGSTVEYGDLQMLPVGDGLLWMRPFYVESQEAGQRTVKYVIVEYNGDVGLGSSFAEALAVIFPGFSTPVGDVVNEDTGTPSTPSDNATPEELLQQAEQLFDDADAALKDGDWATYGEKITAARELVKQALDMLNG